MSVMSAAEARRGAGASPEIPQPRLQIATSAAGHDDADEDGSPLGVGDPAPEGECATERCTTALRVRQVRVVREVSVRTLRADGARPTPAPHAGVAGETPVTGETGVIGQTRVTSYARGASQARVTSHPRGASQARVTSYARGTSQVWRAGQAGAAGPVPRRPGAMRLTRRGRRVVAVFALGVVIVAVTLLLMSAAGSVQASSHASAPGSAYRGMTQVVVQRGQTLWSIAAAAEPSGNAWVVIQQIIDVNALTSANVQAGELLWVPRG
jgi:hypothetical protein